MRSEVGWDGGGVGGRIGMGWVEGVLLRSIPLSTLTDWTGQPICARPLQDPWRPANRQTPVAYIQH